MRKTLEKKWIVLNDKDKSSPIDSFLLSVAKKNWFCANCTGIDAHMGIKRANDSNFCEWVSYFFKLQSDFCELESNLCKEKKNFCNQDSKLC